MEESFPTRERGLKPGSGIYRHRRQQSFPTRERGLKQAAEVNGDSQDRVVPYAGTWIETFIISWFVVTPMLSFPTRERGLKQTFCKTV